MKILAFAYACEPDKGSEPGAGWMWARMLAQLGETWVITRTNNRDAIEAGLDGVPEKDKLQFVYVDLPGWARFWKRGHRGVRLYYLLWQVAALREGRRLNIQHRFDLAWHLTLANVWLGSLAPLVGPRFVYGPVGGGLGVPWRFLSALGTRGASLELVRAIARAIFRYLNPLARLAWHKAALILVQNPETHSWLPRRHRSKAVVFPNAILERPATIARLRRRSRPTALFAGRLVPWKGASLAIRAIAGLPEWHLSISGAGREEHRLRRLCSRLDVSDRVTFLGWQPREEVLRLMSEDADALLLPSLREDAGLAVAEALSRGLPVICLDRGGPSVLCRDEGRLIQANAPAEAVLELRVALASVENAPGCSRAPGDTAGLTHHSAALSTLVQGVSRRSKAAGVLS